MREPSEHPEEKYAANPLPDTPIVGVFFTSKIQGGQDRVFQFCGLANYKVHGDLSYSRPLLRGNSPTSSGLILNMYYKGVSRELKKFAW
jgi:hypothetical protein